MIAWPYNGRPGKVNVQKSSPNPATWIRAQVTFRKVENFFVVLFRSVAPKSDNMYLAIDDVSKKNLIFSAVLANVQDSLLVDY